MSVEQKPTTRIYMAGTNFNTGHAKLWKSDLIESFREREHRLVVEFIDPLTRLTTDPKITIKDKSDIDSCTFFIAYIMYPTFGTSMEVLYAHEHNKFVYVIEPLNQYRMDPWLAFHTNIFFDSVVSCSDFIHSERRNYF